MVPVLTIHTNLLKRFLKNTCDNLLLMKKNLILLSLLISCSSFAQSNLPPCNGNFSDPCVGVRDYDNGQYVGQSKDNQRNGRGTYIFASGNKYVGQYMDGKSYGQGTFTWANGDKYVGQFKDDKYDGFGTFYYANGSIY